MYLKVSASIRPSGGLDLWLQRKGLYLHQELCCMWLDIQQLSRASTLPAIVGGRRPRLATPPTAARLPSIVSFRLSDCRSPTPPSVAAICGQRAPWFCLSRQPPGAAGMPPSAIERVPRPPPPIHRRKAPLPWKPAAFAKITRSGCRSAWAIAGKAGQALSGTKAPCP